MFEIPSTVVEISTLRANFSDRALGKALRSALGSALRLALCSALGSALRLALCSAHCPGVRAHTLVNSWTLVRPPQKCDLYKNRRFTHITGRHNPAACLPC